MKTNLIEFVDMEDHTPLEVYPRPARACLPEWFKKVPTRIPVEDPYEFKSASATVKKCMPFIDSMSTGYILLTPTDVVVERVGEHETKFSWPAKPIVSFQNVEQIPGYLGDGSRKEDYPKWLHPWSIRTPKGYSCLFMPPMHHPSPFKVLEGVVDTDVYHEVVELPFVMKDPNFSGLIPAGTPMAQVVPIKRERFTHSVKTLEELKDKYPIKTRRKVYTWFYDAYRNHFWNKKLYS